MFKLVIREYVRPYDESGECGFLEMFKEFQIPFVPTTDLTYGFYDDRDDFNCDEMQLEKVMWIHAKSCFYAKIKNAPEHERCTWESVERHIKEGGWRLWLDCDFNDLEELVYGEYPGKGYDPNGELNRIVVSIGDKFYSVDRFGLLCLEAEGRKFENLGRALELGEKMGFDKLES